MYIVFHLPEQSILQARKMELCKCNGVIGEIGNWWTHDVVG